MHINLSPEIEQYLQAKVGTGFYSNASEVVRDAIRRMWEEDEKLEKLRAAVKIGDDQLTRGEGLPYSVKRLEDITEKAFENSRNGKKISSDVRG
ncbi:type II toxin-antitoxin system ParD family antitoxin [Methylobacter sp.]|uniref:type II toxin-antitoxin system ParD family antitoxin n=1 Tax=Methylobacter sp. TaxID=2051955 RepID=UPI00120129B8|nr:type II toxin-antitoxin system ParD family antitoxin [Methylobacter sp.]TAK64643.1 MAG: type II toxin-antitoxin system ParD family antitoxin [Methylobacter sp.]